MSRTLLGGFAVAMALAVPSAAHAAASCSVPSHRGGGTTETSADSFYAPKSETSSAVNVCGTVVVAFHGDPAAGCAAMGVCDISGQLGYDARGAGELLAARVGKTTFGGTIEPSGDYLNGTTTHVVALVTRTTADGVQHTCSDTGVFTALTFGNTIAAPLLSVFPYPESPSGDCAGPLATDFIGALPRPNIAGLVRSGGQLDLSGAFPFSGHGFSGTATSTLALGVGKPLNVKLTHGGSSGYGVEATYTLTGLHGTIAAQLADGGGGTCAGLDACGLKADLLDTVASSAGTVLLAADVPARDHRLPLLEQLADARDAGGDIDPQSGFTLSATVTRADEPQPCVDTVTDMLTGFEFDAARSRGVVTDLALPQGDPFRSRCAGPAMADLGSNPEGFPGVAVGSVKVGQLAHRTITLELTQATRVSNEAGYNGTITPSLTLTARLRSIRAIP